jgi:hypothetical protein
MSRKQKKRTRRRVREAALDAMRASAPDFEQAVAAVGKPTGIDTRSKVGGGFWEFLDEVFGAQIKRSFFGVDYAASDKLDQIALAYNAKRAPPVNASAIYVDIDTGRQVAWNGSDWVDVEPP